MNTRNHSKAFLKPQGCEGTAVGTTNNAYSGVPNVAAIRTHHELGIVPPKFVHIAARVLGIPEEEVGIKRG